MNRYLQESRVAVRNIVDGGQAAGTPMLRTAFRATVVTDVLVIIPDLIAGSGAARRALDEHSTVARTGTRVRSSAPVSSVSDDFPCCYYKQGEKLNVP